MLRTIQTAIGLRGLGAEQAGCCKQGENEANPSKANPELLNSKPETTPN